MFSFDEFDPHTPENKALALVAQTTAISQAKAIEGDTLPFPPNNLPVLKSIPGNGISGAHVLGYIVREAVIMDCVAPDGSRKVPGDKGFYEANMGRLKAASMPKGWMFESRQAHKLFALVSGNPILLENQAKSQGYSRATATQANMLDLGEIEVEVELGHGKPIVQDGQVTATVEVVGDGQYLGKIEQVTDQFVVQHVGRGRLVSHEIGRFLNAVPAVGEVGNVTYKDGQANWGGEISKGISR